MVDQIEGIMIGSPDAKKLADFYKNKVGLKISMEGEVGDNGEKFYMFDIKKGGGFVIMHHKEVRGKNHMPARYIMNFEVEDIKKETKRLKDEGVKVIKDVYHIQDYGFIATFEDPDGNYFQFCKTRE